MIWFQGRNSRIVVAITGVRPMPPPTSTLKPSSPAGAPWMASPSLRISCRPTSCQAVAARSSRAPLMAILNLRGRKANSGCSVLHWRRISANGRGSAISSTATPARSSLVMLRMQLPLVWMPCRFTLASRSITSAEWSSGIQLNCTFWRVEKWP
jgi:hypothetical protein